MSQQARAQKAIKGNVVMISGCKDSQTSADVANTSAFGIDNGPGGAGGACTNSMIQALQNDPSPTWAGLLNSMRTILQESKYTQVPMLSSGKPLALDAPFTLDAPEANEYSNRKAALVGINYVGTRNQLSGCHNDVETMKRYLMSQGFDEGEMRLLLDDNEHEEPSHANILDAMKWLVKGAKKGDSLFFHYSGHGTSMKDDDGDEEDGKDEAIVPADYAKAGLCRDDEILKALVLSLPQGVRLTCIFDCCHSGTIMDLPFVFKADNEADFNNPTMVENAGFNPAVIVGLLGFFFVGPAGGCGLCDMIVCCLDCLSIFNS